MSGFLILLYSVLQGVWFPAPALIHVARYLVSCSCFVLCCNVSGFLILLCSLLHGVCFPDPAMFYIAWCVVSWSCSVPCCMVSGSVPVCKVSGSLLLLRSKVFARCLVSWSCFILCSKLFSFLILLYSVFQGVWFPDPALFRVARCLVSYPNLFVLHGVWNPDPSMFRVARWLVPWSFYIPCRKVSCFLILLFRVASWRCLVDHGWVLFCLVSKCVWFFDIALFHFTGCLVVIWYCSFASLCGSLILLSSVWFTFGRSMFHVAMCFVKLFDHVVFHVAT